MEEKYQNLRNIENIIQITKARLYKEEDKYINVIKNVMDFVNNDIELNDNVYEDIIELIIDITELTIEQFIEDINKTIKYKQKNKQGISEVFSKNDIITYMKQFPNVSLLIAPINILLVWSFTTKGYEFYKQKNIQVSKNLYTENIIFL